LSGIDYDPESKIYNLLSDHEEARYYSSRLFIPETGMDSLKFLSAHSLWWPKDSTMADADP
jgi:hypothetical protein